MRLLRRCLNRGQTRHHLHMPLVFLLLLALDVVHTAFYVADLRKQYTVLLSLGCVVRLRIPAERKLPEHDRTRRPDDAEHRREKCKSAHVPTTST